MRISWQRFPKSAELLALAIAIVVVPIIGLLAYGTWTDFNRSNEEVEISQRIIDDTNELLASLKDAETGQRGFLVTAQDRYLDPYRQALTEVPNVLDKLAKVTDLHRPDQAERVKRLRPLIQDKLGELRETIEVRQIRGSAAAIAIVETDHGKAVMDQIRILCAEIQLAAKQRVMQFSAEARASSNR